ncbi:MAG TPA: alanine racemase [Thermodesulfobacteriota bacterium]|nr:alanine racemase [Deltaproteobacteria bacterium]HNR12028.1 alanine racemase [Thermodesulfobacteriota bacterium]HNU71631.1 alanine racemase [Thermodesulfobacteriota bacterium]HOC37937.1 alanine racemase [Thermodesulfobacteriota bacterium]
MSCAEIDLDALAFNVTQVSSLIGKKRKILAVVKANAYGHGAVEIARVLESLSSIEYFGVAFPEEGIHLRQAGIRKPILILAGILPEHVESMYEYQLTPVIYDLDTVTYLEDEGRRRQQSLAVHLKVDTGMNRLGVSPGGAENFLVRWKQFQAVHLEGILSHFSSAHLKDEESEAFTRKQVEEFRQVASLLEGHLGVNLLVHMSSSSSLMKGLAPELSLVRLGLLLYGADPTRGQGPEIPLKSVMTVKTRILQVKRVMAGSPVSYGRTFCTGRETTVATIGIGYGDGFCHGLSNRGCVLVHGKRAPVVGAVCMDLTMIDVTDIPKVRPGDEVVLFGHQGNACLPVEEVASQAGTIAYAVLCGISGRVPRLYRRMQS